MVSEVRKNGYYWVQQYADERWFIAEWSDQYWLMIGDEQFFYDNNFMSIGPWVGNTFEDDIKNK